MCSKFKEKCKQIVIFEFIKTYFQMVFSSAIILMINRGLGAKLL